MFAKKDTPRDLAGERLAEGHTVYVVSYQPKIKISDQPRPDFADLIEDIESAGWHLEHVLQGAGALYLVFRAVTKSLGFRT